jgi:hypothetical protein
MTMTRTKIIMGFILIAAIVGISYVWSSMPNVPGWKKGYSQIKVGDSKQKVVEILGKPTEIKDCYDTRHSSSPEIVERCAEEYWYIAFMQEWGYVFDKDGKVLTKWHSVSS